MKKKYIPLLLAVFLLFSCKQTKPSFHTEVYSVTNGYGYLIKHGLKIIVKQEYIPAISGKQAFCTAEDAQKIANLVVNKITNQQNPKVTIREMEDLDIHFNCLDLQE